MSHTINPVFRSLNRPLLLLGVDRRLFFLLLSSALAVFNLSGALAPALILFAALWTAARLATRKDPHFLQIVVNTRRFAARYDPAKFSPSEQKGAASRGFVQKAV
jgi:type IV secretory pathway TrbD component